MNRWTTYRMNSSSHKKTKTNNNSSNRNWKSNRINKCSLDLRHQHSKYLTNKILIRTASSERMFPTLISLLILEDNSRLNNNNNNKTIKQEKHLLFLFQKEISWEFRFIPDVFLSMCVSFFMLALLISIFYEDNSMRI